VREPSLKQELYQSLKFRLGVDENKTWSEEELAQFERAYPLGSYERLVYSILLYTGLRIGDAARLESKEIQTNPTLIIGGFCDDAGHGQGNPNELNPRLCMARWCKRGTSLSR
jgi:integrase